MGNLIVIIVCALAIAAWWILMPIRAVLHDRKLGALSAMPCVEPERWPPVSVLVPARNEEDALAEAVQSLLEVDYPELEIILVNDRSNDRTGEIADRLARQDARVRTLHIETLPEGWMGKVHAMHRGIAISRGEWLLFTDADIHFSPQVLKRAIAYCLRRKRAFLTLFPGFADTGLIIGATQSAFGVMFLVAQIPPSQYFYWTPWLYAAGIGLLVAVLLVGDVGKGAQRWLSLGPVNFQPSELSKFAVIVALAAVMERKERVLQDFGHFLAPVAMILATTGLLVMLQPDLGTTIVIVASALAVLLVSAAPLRYISLVTGLGVVVTTILAFSEPYRRARITGYLDPWADAEGAGWQLIQRIGE